MVLERGIIVDHLVQENATIQCVLLLLLIALVLVKLLTNTILQLHVLTLLFDELVEFNRFVQLIPGEGFWRFINSWLSNIVHHLTVLRGELILDLPLQLRLVFLRLCNL